MKIPEIGCRKGFSLVEVVVAVGIFALAIVGVIGLLSPTTKAVGDVSDSDAATRVVSIVQSELQALASTSAGWNSFTTGSNAILRLSSEVAAYDNNPPSDYSSVPYVLFASKDGGIVGAYSSTKWDGGTTLEKDGRKFFEIILIRNWSPGDSTADPPIAASGLSNPANDTTAGYLAYTIRLRWPAFLPNGVRVTDNSQKNVLIVPAAVTR